MPSRSDHSGLALTAREEDYHNRVLANARRERSWRERAILKDGEPGAWYALRVSPICETVQTDVAGEARGSIEQRVASRLAVIGIRNEVPLCKVVKRNRMRKKIDCLVPVMKGYVFVCLPFRPEALVAVQGVAGVLSVVGDYGGRAKQLSERQLARFARAAKVGYFDTRYRLKKKLRPGLTVAIIDGSLKGFEAIVAACDGDRDVLLETILFGRRATFAVDLDNVKIVEKTPISAK